MRSFSTSPDNIKDAARLLVTYHTPVFAYADPKDRPYRQIPTVRMFSAFSAFAFGTNSPHPVLTRDYLRVCWQSDLRTEHSTDFALRGVKVVSLMVRNNNEPPNSGFGEGLVMQAANVQYLGSEEPVSRPYLQDFEEARRLLTGRDRFAREAGGRLLRALADGPEEQEQPDDYQPGYYSVDIYNISLNPRLAVDKPVGIPIAGLREELTRNPPAWWFTDAGMPAGGDAISA